MNSYAGRSFSRGLLTNLANPKAVVYFGSVFSLFVGEDVGAAQRWGLFLLIVMETLAWFSLVSWLRCAGVISVWQNGLMAWQACCLPDLVFT